MEKKKVTFLYDVRQGILRRYYIYLILFAPFMMLAWRSAAMLELFGERVTFVNILVNMFKGCMEFSGDDNGFQLPIDYTAIILFSSLIHGWYVKNEFSRRGTLVILRMKNIAKWWRGKCVWGICSTLIYIAIILISVLIMNFIKGTGEMGVTEGVKSIFQPGLVEADNGIILLYTAGMAFATLVFLTQLQIFLQICFSPVVAMAVNMAIMVVSAFDFKWYNVGNNIMLFRTQLMRENGMMIEDAVMMCLLGWVILAVLGRWYMGKKEMYC